MDIAEQIKIRKRVDAATPPPWTGGYFQWGGFDHLLGRILNRKKEYRPQSDRDAEFIAHARDDVPALLDEVGRLRAKIGLLRQFALSESEHWEGKNADRMYEANVFLHEIDR